MYFCEKCNSKQNAKHIDKIEILPQILIINLKRFETGKIFNSKVFYLLIIDCDTYKIFN